MTKNILQRSSNDKKQSLEELKWRRTTFKERQIQKTIFKRGQMTKKQSLEELKWQKTNYKRPQRTNLKRSSKDEK